MHTNHQEDVPEVFDVDHKCLEGFWCVQGRIVVGILAQICNIWMTKQLFLNGFVLKWISSLHNEQCRIAKPLQPVFSHRKYYGGGEKIRFFKVIRIDKFSQKRFKNAQNLHLKTEKYVWRRLRRARRKNKKT